MGAGILEASMLKGLVEIVEQWPASQHLLMSYMVVLNVIFAVAKRFGHGNGVLISAIAWALVFLVPKEAVASMHVMIQHFAIQMARTLNMPKALETIFNVSACAMMWVPWQWCKPHTAEEGPGGRPRPAQTGEEVQKKQE
mmetsp:Transcript_12705/g.35129  ORF Transcript_12705/g.35129 Transcript_12705/m.35129 type:complete len:140 (-) Transcript_12705:200-619(-)|eukprot:CAMPEP_0179103238 /NCGR_PEP_ID=MMETSP0796-20121207/47824_1 /TAXON_ID=73915 /ORGANISM="Pyrodinium bahamense, Strain pbaha01" /LENGTH=139 /DNA_ID=CAMNT_0020801137 /DNA_START=57 /DNA_END=476 /DNA_ORIENTATION=-